MKIIKTAVIASISFLFCQCALQTPSDSNGSPNMAGPTVDERNAAIACEATGDFYYGRRYYVQKTRFWGYLRNPRQSADKAKLVIIREDRKYNPDRLPESNPSGQSYGFDQNYEYRLRGNYTGETAYDPNSNQFLPVFLLTGYDVVNRNPGWLFTPADHYNPLSMTLRPR